MTPMSPIVLRQWNFIAQKLNQPQNYHDRIDAFVKWMTRELETELRTSDPTDPTDPIDLLQKRLTPEEFRGFVKALWYESRR